MALAPAAACGLAGGRKSIRRVLAGRPAGRRLPCSCALRADAAGGAGGEPAGGVGGCRAGAALPVPWRRLRGMRIAGAGRCAGRITTISSRADARAANDAIMTCVSRAKTPELVLDF